MVKLSELVAPSFYELFYDVEDGRHTHYWLKGGRGSTKSSFVSIEIVLGIMQHPEANAVAIRKVGLYLKDSVYEQLGWAIDKLGAAHLWQTKLSPLELIYLPTGQRILFRGADKPQKLKSTKVRKGYIRYVWYEEVDEFTSIDEINVINQSLLRGGDKFCVFYSYNPPRIHANWVNKEVQAVSADSVVHHSTYLTVPPQWLGQQFYREAEHLKSTCEEKYRHNYLGEIVGNEGLILRDWEVRDFDIDFDVEFLGQDFGFNHANAILQLGFLDDTIYVQKELYVHMMDTGEIIQRAEGMFDKSKIMWCDCAEPDRIKTWAKAGYRAAGVSKEQNSVKAQIDYLMGHHIVIHPSCVNTIDEIEQWEWLKDKQTDKYIDEPVPVFDDAMAALRYGIEYMRKAKR